jgi:soluble lytic murein transglycosylase-like protein
MQVLPGTAQRYGVTRLTSVPENLRAGAHHLRTLQDMFGERLDLVLAAYNAGEGAVRRHNNAIPPYRETRAYVPAVLKRYKPVRLPAPAPEVSKQREYVAGTRLDPDALLRLR